MLLPSQTIRKRKIVGKRDGIIKDLTDVNPPDSKIKNVINPFYCLLNVGDPFNLEGLQVEQ
jgi:hypothetical protein